MPANRSIEPTGLGRRCADLSAPARGPGTCSTTALPIVPDRPQRGASARPAAPAATGLPICRARSVRLRCGAACGARNGLRVSAHPGRRTTTGSWPPIDTGIRAPPEQRSRTRTRHLLYNLALLEYNDYFWRSHPAVRAERRLRHDAMRAIQGGQQRIAPFPHWNLLSEHSGAYLRLRRLLTGRRSFTLCFLTYSDSAYRDRVARFLKKRLRADDPRRYRSGRAHRHGGALREPGRELEQTARPSSPVRNTGPEGFDNLLVRLNRRRESLAAWCPRPLLFWVLSRHLPHVATRAADLWAWRSGVFDFALPPHRRPRGPAAARSRWVQSWTPPTERRASRGWRRTWTTSLRCAQAMWTCCWTWAIFRSRSAT